MASKSESDLETEILNFLISNGIFAWRNNSTGIFNAKTGAWQNGNVYAIPGVSDILGILPDGRFLAVEVKKPGNGIDCMSLAQKSFIRRISSAGGMAFCADSMGYVVMKLAPYLPKKQ